MIVIIKGFWSFNQIQPDPKPMEPYRDSFYGGGNDAQGPQS